MLSISFYLKRAIIVQGFGAFRWILSFGLDADEKTLAGSTYMVAGPPVRGGFDFAGWVADSDGVVYRPGDIFIMPTQDVNLTAQWTAMSTVTEPPETGDGYAWWVGWLAGCAAIGLFVLQTWKRHLD